MITQKQQEQLTADAISGKTARACESCLKSRARWFCPADDAFLCHTCDSSVHSANELAARHNRVRLQTASSKPNHHHHHHDVSPKSSSTPPPSDLPTWHQGFQKKARTPRNAKRAGPKSSAQTMMMPVVPEMSGGSDHDEGSLEESEEHMVFSVPTFEPFEDEGFNISLIGFQGEEEGNNNNNNNNNIVGLGLGLGVGGVGDDDHWDHFNLPEFDDLPPENDLAEFAADVESLLQQQEGTDEEAIPVLLETSTETDSKRPALLMPSEKGFFKNEVKVEDPEEDDDEDEVMIESNCEDQFDWAMDLENEVLNFEMSNNCGGKFEDEEEEEKKVVVMKRAIEEEGLVLGNDNEEISEGKSSSNKKRKIFLRLNYEEIINTWGGPSPWTTGCRPEFDVDHDGWPNYMGGVDPLESYFDGGVVRRNANGSDVGRQARVSRYREKRRKRLFSKKIRYEVRKLNAEKRPRLKGRFVKRASSVGHGSIFPSYLNNK